VSIIDTNSTSGQVAADLARRINQTIGGRQADMTTVDIIHAVRHILWYLEPGQAGSRQPDPDTMAMLDALEAGSTTIGWPADVRAMHAELRAMANTPFGLWTLQRTVGVA
jgi:hypothetical protein